MKQRKLFIVDHPGIQFHTNAAVRKMESIDTKAEKAQISTFFLLFVNHVYPY